MLLPSASIAATAAGSDSDEVSAPAASAPASDAGCVNSLSHLAIEVVHPTILTFCPVDDVSFEGLRKFYQDSSESYATTMRQLNIITADGNVAQRLKYYEEHFHRAHQSLGFHGHVSTITRRLRYEQAMLTLSAHSCSTLRVFRAFLDWLASKPSREADG